MNKVAEVSGSSGVCTSLAVSQRPAGKTHQSMQIATLDATEHGVSSLAAFFRRSASRHWPTVLMALLLVLLYAPVLRGLVVQWHEGDYSHGFLVPIFSAYLVHRRRNTLAAVPRKPSLLGLLVVVGSQGLYLLGSLGAELFLTRVSLIFTICGLVIYFLGWAGMRALAFPLGFLFLMVPLPALVYNEIVFPLQLLASRFATTCLKATGIVPVVREGNLLILPYYTLELVEACSGIRSLMSLVALAVAYGYMAEKRIIVRILLVALMVPTAVMSNGFRVMVTAVLTRSGGPKAAEGFLHAFSGWVLFLAAAMCLFLIHGLIIKVGELWQRRALA